MLIIGILLGIAVPTYLHFTDKAHNTAAQADVRAAVPAMEAFYADNSTYIGVNNAATGTPPGLAFYDPASSAHVTIPAASLSVTGYCIQATDGSATFHKSNPAGSIVTGACP